MGVYTDDLYQAGAREERLFWWDQAKLTWWPVLSRLEKKAIADYEAELARTMGGKVYTPNVWKKVAQTLIFRNPGLLAGLSGPVRQDFVAGKLNPALISRAVADPEFLMFILDQERMKFAHEVIAKRLERFRQRCSGKDMPVWVVFLPGSSLVAENYLGFKQVLGYRMSPEVAHFPMDDYLRPVVEQVGFKYESVLNSFRADGCPGCFYPYDGHLTALGHMRVADYLVPLMAEWLGK